MTICSCNATVAVAITRRLPAAFAAGIAARLPGQVLWCVIQADLFAPGLAQAGLSPAEYMLDLLREQLDGSRSYY